MSGTGDTCFACGGLIMKPGVNYGWGGKICYCPKDKPNDSGGYQSAPLGVPITTIDTALQVKLVPNVSQERKIIAIKAMQAIESGNVPRYMSPDDVADRAVLIADALLNRLNK